MKSPFDVNTPNAMQVSDNQDASSLILGVTAKDGEMYFWPKGDPWGTRGENSGLGAGTGGRPHVQAFLPELACVHRVPGSRRTANLFRQQTFSSPCACTALGNRCRSRTPDPCVRRM
jgi:hypothetical protein